MTDLVQMIAISAGTVSGPDGIVHVNPASKRENGRYSHPLVSEATAVLLEKRKLAVRESDLQAMTAQLIDTDGRPVELETVVLQPGQVEASVLLPIGDGIATIDQGAVPAPAAAAATVSGAAEAGSGPVASGDLVSVATADIATGLSDDDADIAPAAAAAAPEAKAAPAPGKPRPQR